ARYRLDDRLLHRELEFGRVIGLAALLPEQHVDHRLRPRQTADMGRENAVGAELHMDSPVSLAFALTLPSLPRRAPPSPQGRGNQLPSPSGRGWRTECAG